MTEHHDPADAAARWLSAFDAAVRQQDAQGAADLFLADAHWRDILAFTWHFVTISGRPRIRAAH
jgi:putative flavoprotein involved in K+ transport